MATGVQIGALHVSLSAESAAFEQGMQGAADEAKDSMGRIGDYAKQAAGILAAAFAFDFMKDRIKEQIDYADSLADVAARSNQTVESLSAMEYALHFSDASIEDYTSGLEKLSQNMVAVAEGNKAQEALFETLGIKVQDNSGHMRNAADVMLDISDKLHGMEDGAVKTNLAMDLLGKSAGPALLPHLNQGSAAIRELTDEARELGAVVSTDASEAAGQLNDNLDKLNFAATGLWRTAAVQLSPVLGEISENMLKSASGTSVMEGASTALGVAIKTMYTGFKATVIELGYFGDVIGKISAMAVSAATGDFAQAKAIWDDTSGNERATADLMALGDMWQDTGAKAVKSGQDQEEAARKAAEAMRVQKALADSTKEKKPKAEKDNFQYGGLSLSAVEYNNASTAEDLSNQQYLAQDQLETDRFLDGIDQMLVEQDAANTIAEQQWGELVDSELTRMDEANVYKLNAHKGLLAGFLALDQQRLADVVTNGDIELEERKRQMAKTVDFFHAGLNSMAQGQGKAAKAARNIQKAEALYQIGVNTYSAAMGAYNALAPIPFVGPALGVAAAAAAIGFGASMAQGVMSGGSGGAVAGGAPPALSSTSSVVPQSEQRAAEQAPVTYMRIPENAVLSGRMLLDLIDDAMGDGKQPANLRFIPT